WSRWETSAGWPTRSAPSSRTRSCGAGWGPGPCAPRRATTSARSGGSGTASSPASRRHGGRARLLARPMREVRRSGRGPVDRPPRGRSRGGALQPAGRGGLGQIPAQPWIGRSTCGGRPIPSLSGMDDAALSLTSVTKSFGSVRAVDGITLTVPRGQTVALLGPNGAGKSTTIAVLLGLLPPDSGEVTLFGGPPEHAVR